MSSSLSEDSFARSTKSEITLTRFDLSSSDGSKCNRFLLFCVELVSEAGVTGVWTFGNTG